MAIKRKTHSHHTLQPYARVTGDLLSRPELYPLPAPTDLDGITTAVVEAFKRSKLSKRGELRHIAATPEELVAACIEHLRERSDPILSPSFFSQCAIEDIFELDAIGHEMQRHRMTMGVFYQYLLLELVRLRFTKVFDGSGEDDITADIDTPNVENHTQGLRLYMSVKKSGDTVGGQDVAGAIFRLERRAKQEKNLTRPYLCVMAVATPTAGKIRAYEDDRKIKYDKNKKPYSMNCETWGPGFVYPFLTGRSPNEIYSIGLKQVASHLPFRTLAHKGECSELLRSRFKTLGVIDANDRIDASRFLTFCSSEGT